MATPREAIYSALLDRLKTIQASGGAITVSRVLLSIDDTPPAMCPAIFLTATGEERIVRRGMPGMVKIAGTIYVYAKNDQGRDGVPSSQLNAIISDIEDALQRKPTDGPITGALFPQNPDLTFGTTLGGLCYTCSIGQRIEIIEGFGDSTACAIIPFEAFTAEGRA